VVLQADLNRVLKAFKAANLPPVVILEPDRITVKAADLANDDAAPNPWDDA
jgi:hypothetical protein